MFDARSSFSERKIAEKIWYRLKKPKIDLTNAETEYGFLFINENVYCGLLEHVIDKSILKRKPHHKPCSVPISLHPKLARCIVNLTGIRSGTIVDPFSGTGGILVEAGLMNLKVEGYDIEQKMIDMAKKNIRYYNIKNNLLKKRDALDNFGKVRYIVTDLPYGKNTKSVELEKLYLGFLKNLEKNLEKRAVIVFPDTINYKKMLKKTDLKILDEFSYYIHKTMTKKIVVLSV